MKCCRRSSADGNIYCSQGATPTHLPNSSRGGAYDFSRFSLSGHRWLYRQFEQLAAGSVGGAGTASVWSFRNLCRALGAGNKVATLLSLAVFYLRFLDRFTKRRPNADVASGTYFLGTKSQRTLAPREMVRYYEDQTRP
jgi:hypothetical protein